MIFWKKSKINEKKPLLNKKFTIISDSETPVRKIDEPILIVI